MGWLEMCLTGAARRRRRRRRRLSLARWPEKETHKTLSQESVKEKAHFISFSCPYYLGGRCECDFSGKGKCAAKMLLFAGLIWRAKYLKTPLLFLSVQSKGGFFEGEGIYSCIFFIKGEWGGWKHLQKDPRSKRQKMILESWGGNLCYVFFCFKKS